MDFMGHQLFDPLGCLPFSAQVRAHFLSADAFHESFGLSEIVGHQGVVMSGHRIGANHGADKVRRNDICALVQQLIESVLTIDAYLTPDQRADRKSTRLNSSHVATSY